MSRLLIPTLFALLVLTAHTQDMEASPGPQSLRTITSENHDESPRHHVAIEAVAANEAEVRAKAEEKLEPPTPEIWKTVRSYAYAKLPQHNERSFQAVWIGMTVKTTDETVAAVGLKGTWW